MSDRRVWTPDETCEPFLLESAAQNVNIPVLEWRVPSHNEAVIASLMTNENAFAGLRKRDFRLTIERGKKVSSGVIPPGEGIKTTGGLSDVIEWEIGAPDKNIPGFVIFMGGSGNRPCRVILPSGPYQLWFRGLTGQVVTVSMFGWTYPVKYGE